MSSLLRNFFLQIVEETFFLNKSTLAAFVLEGREMLLKCGA